MSVRTFDLAPLISALSTSSQDARLESIDYAADHLFIGTCDGWIHRYSVHVTTSSTGRNIYHSKLLASKRITSKKAVLDVKVIDPINRVLYLCDGVLGMLDAATVEIVQTSGSKVKNVSGFSLNDRIDPENPFISYEVCVVKKKMLQIFSISETEFNPLMEMNLHEMPLKLVYSDPFVCFASSSQYHIVNVKETTHQIHHLFPYPHLPVIASLTDSELHEFLLSGPGGLGMFVSAQSLVAPRPPINWAELQVTRMQYSAPYILVYSNEDIWVYSSINQQPKQSLQFDRCRSLCQATFEGRMHATPLMASDSQVWALENVPWQEQVEALLADKRVDEALQIARSYCQEDTSQFFRDLLKRAALIQLHRHELQLAKQLLLESQAAPEDILGYCPDLFPQADVSLTSPFYIELFSSDSPIVIQKRNHFLIEYLEEIRRSSVQFTSDMNLILLKLLTQSNQHVGLLAFVKSYRNVLPYPESSHVLEESGRFAALAFFQFRMGHVQEAVTLLKELIDGSRVDSVDGDAVSLTSMVDLLQSVDQKQLVLETLPWLLKKDQLLALQVLKDLTLEENADINIHLLEPYPTLRLVFLEYLIFQRNSQQETLHTELAGTYLHHLANLPQSNLHSEGDGWEIRTKLQTVLRSPRLKENDDLMKLVETMQLQQERVILLAKSGQHFAALDLLAHQLKDRAGAVDYCVQYGREDKSLKRQMFEHLLAIYFNPKEQNEESVRAALELLNDEEADFDPSKVLSILPANWPLQCLQGFLSHTLRRSLHTQRTAIIEQNLSRSLYFSARLSTVANWSQKIVLSEERRCVFCKKRFLDCSFNRLTDGRLAHIQCHSSTQ